jgi:hypothetical protein
MREEKKAACVAEKSGGMREKRGGKLKQIKRGRG